MNVEEIQTALDENVRRGLMEQTTSGGYRLTPRGEQSVEAMPNGGAWAWVETMTVLRNYDRALTAALEGANAPPLSAAGFQALLALYADAPNQPSALARTTGIPATGFTPVLDRLQELGLVTRRSHPDDRRGVLIHLTDAGEALRGTLVPLAQQLNDRLWQAITSLPR